MKRSVAALFSALLAGLVLPATSLAQVRPPQDPPKEKDRKERSVRVHAVKDFGDEDAPPPASGDAGPSAPVLTPPAAAPASPIAPSTIAPKAPTTTPPPAININAVYQLCWAPQPVDFTLFPIPAAWQPILIPLGGSTPDAPLAITGPPTHSASGTLATLSLTPGIGIPTPAGASASPAAAVEPPAVPPPPGPR